MLHGAVFLKSAPLVAEGKKTFLILSIIFSRYGKIFYYVETDGAAIGRIP
jgi:hypothetical protein